MPTYRFRNKTTGEEFDEMVKMADKEQYMKDNNLESVITGLNMVHQTGTTLPVDDGLEKFKIKLLKHIKSIQ